MASSCALSRESSSLLQENSRGSENPSSATGIFPVVTCQAIDVSRESHTGDERDERENAFGAGYSPNVLCDHLNFWSTLSKSEKEMFARSAEAIPMDAMGGLMQPGKILYQRKGWKFPFLVNLARIVLNLYVTLTIVYRFHENDGRIIFGRHSMQTTEMFGDHVTICDKMDRYRTISNASSSGEPTEWSHYCVQHDLKRFFSLHMISWFECVTMVLMTLYMLIGWLAFLLLHKRCSTPQRNPAIFLFLPKIASKFSAVSFLQLLNISRVRALVERREWILIWTLFRDLIPYGSSECCSNGDPYDANNHPSQDPEDDCEDDDYEESMLCCQKKKFRDDCQDCLFFVVLCLGSIVAVAVGFQAFLAKLTEVHFVTVTSFDAWDPHEWLMAVGFMNQMVGMCWVDEIEFARIMMFKFGGWDCTWTWQRSQACVAYLRLVVHKVAGADGYLHRHHHEHYVYFPETCHRIKAVAVLANIDASGLHLMLQSRTRENYLSKRRMETLRRFEPYYDDRRMDGTSYEASPEECEKHKEHCETSFHNEWKDYGEAVLKIVEQMSAEKSSVLQSPVNSLSDG